MLDDGFVDLQALNRKFSKALNVRVSDTIIIKRNPDACLIERLEILSSNHHTGQALILSHLDPNLIQANVM